MSSLSKWSFMGLGPSRELRPKWVNIFPHGNCRDLCPNAHAASNKSQLIKSHSREKKNGSFHREISVPCTSKGYYNVTTRPSRGLLAEMEGIKLELVILQKQVEANTRSLSSDRQMEETIINEELQPLELTRLRNQNPLVLYTLEFQITV